MYGWLLRSLHSSGSWQSVFGVKCQAGQVHLVCGEFLGLKEHCGYYKIPSWCAGALRVFLWVSEAILIASISVGCMSESSIPEKEGCLGQ